MDKTGDPEIDWSLATWEGSRRQQHRDLLALPFRKKMEIIEGLAEVSAVFKRRRLEQGLPVVGPSGRPLQVRVGETSPSYQFVPRYQDARSGNQTS